MDTAAAYWVIYVSLAFYAAVAIAGSYFMMGGGSAYWKGVLSPSSEFVRAKSQSPISLSLSLFATAMGIWALTAAPETAFFTGWFGLLGYAAVCAVPWTILAFFGPKVRAVSPKGITIVDFLAKRYGSEMAVLQSVVSIVSMWIAMCAELIGAGGAMAALVPGFPTLGVTLPIALVTILYTAVSGFPASIATDRVQAVIAVPLILVVIVAVFVGTPDVPPESWAVANVWTWEGVCAACVLILSVTLLEFGNQTTWQRIFSARDSDSAKWGLLVGSSLTILAMVLFGIVGLLALAADDAGIVEVPPGDAYNSLFILLGRINSGWRVTAAVLAVCLACSSLDSFQNAIVAVMSRYRPEGYSMNWARIPGTIVALAAVPVAAVDPPSIMSIFMLANIIGASLAPVIFLGVTPYVTSLGAGLGFVAGMSATVVIGWIRLQTFGGGFKWFLFPNGFYNWDCLMTFVLVPLISAGVACGVAQLQFARDAALFEEQEARLHVEPLHDMSDMPTSSAHKEPSVQLSVASLGLSNRS